MSVKQIVEDMYRSSDKSSGEGVLPDGLVTLEDVESSMDHNLCLDMLQVSWGSGDAEPCSETAILLEISREGGLILTSVAIPSGTLLTMKTEGRSILASVVSCKEDDFGFAVLFAADQSASWFPEGFKPSHLLAA